jgi:hypothetical protein
LALGKNVRLSEKQSKKELWVVVGYVPSKDKAISMIESYKGDNVSSYKGPVRNGCLCLRPTDPFLFPFLRPVEGTPFLKFSESVS